MRASLVLWWIWCSVLASAPHVDAEVRSAEENWLAVRGNERIVGRLEAGGRDIFVLHAISGTSLDLDLQWSDGGAGVLELFDPKGAIDIEAFSRTSEERQRARKIVLAATGLHYIAVRATRAGSYQCVLRVRAPRQQREAAEDVGSGVRFELAANRGDELAMTWRSPRGSSYEPRLLSLRAPDGTSVVHELLRGPAGVLRVSFSAAQSGLYEARIGDPQSQSAVVTLSLRRKSERLQRTDWNLELLPSPLEAFSQRDPSLDAWRRLHRLAALETTARSFQESSFDRTAGNDDGLSGVHTILRIEGTEAVVFDQQGPGIVERIHFAFRSTPGTHLGYLPNAEQYRVRFFFDDETTPRIDLPVQQFVSGTQAPFLAPAVGNDTLSPGGPFVYTPMPFARRLIIRTTGPAYYLHVNWRRLELDAALPSFEPTSVDPAPLSSLLAAQGGSPHAANAVACRESMRLALSPGSVGDAFTLDTAGWITALEVVPDASSRALISDLQLEIRFDGAAVPDVDCPLDLFFGCGLGEATVRALMFEIIRGGAYRCWWPMPFHSGVRVRIRNRSRAAIGIEVRTQYVPVPYGGRFGTFRAQVREVFPPPLAQWINLRDYRMYAANGQGKIVGLSMVVGSDGLLGAPQQRTYLEGDEHVHVDGLRTPTHHGTGTEEIWNWGWYEAGFAVPFALELHGFPERRINGLADYTSGYRVMVGDPIPYAIDIDYGVEQGPEGYDAARYRCVAFAYHRSDAAASLADQLDVGDVGSESAHAYQSSASTRIEAFTSQFEGERLEPEYTVDGRRETARHAFRMAIAPGNRGAWLRRVYDAADGVPFPAASIHYGEGQRARVFVDGIDAGIWDCAQRNIWRRLRESEFALPSALCVGKTQLLIEIEPLSREWNALEYRLYSRLR